MPKLTIDGMEIEVEQGTSILQAAKLLGIEIPHFCYHDRLSVPANCRMCLVEVEGGPPKPVASCAMAAGEGMVVKTGSEMVQKARKGVMEMLLINHPLDCPICDQGGECDLQDQAVGYGFDRSRYYENKRAVKDKDFGPLVKTVMTRCIQCTRCVRFSEEIAGISDLGGLNRGENLEIGTFVDRALTTEMSGNLVDICPVGALTSKPYAFNARPWELTKTETVDVMDAVGCNIRVDSRGDQVLRILPRLHEDVNEEWINDRTRYACDGLTQNRLDRPWIRNPHTGTLQEATWEEAVAFTAARLMNTPGEKIAALVGDLCDVESVFALKELMVSLESPHMDCRTDGALLDTSCREGYLFNTTISGLEQADAILLVGTNPKHEATLINARIRKLWLETSVPVALIGQEVDLTYPVQHLGTHPAVLEDILSGKHAFSSVLKNAKNPVLILGNGALCRPDGEQIQSLCRDVANAFDMVREDWNGFNVLHGAASRVGALDVGFLPQAPQGRDARAILEGTRTNHIEVLYLLGSDEFDVTGCVGPNTFVIYQGHHGDKGAPRADVILPGCAYTEKNALYVNTEGRVQLARRAVHAPGEAKEDWKILRALSEAIRRPLSYDTLAALRGKLASEFPHFADLDVIHPKFWGSFGTSGALADEPFWLPVKDFYQTNAICRASQTMAECSRTFVSEEAESARSKAA